MQAPWYDPAFTPLQQAEVAARAAWSLMHDARRRSHSPEHRDEWALGLAIGYSFALRLALSLRRQLRPPRILGPTVAYGGAAWRQIDPDTLVRLEPDRFTPAWIEQHPPVDELAAARLRRATSPRELCHECSIYPVANPATGLCAQCGERARARFTQ